MDKHLRKETGKRIFSGLQVARGLAALLVVMCHATLGADNFYGDSPFDGFWQFGHIGVDFFFVLSGFIIYWVHSSDLKNNQYLYLYGVKRVLRIYPAFLPVSLAMLLAYTLAPDLSRSDRETSVLASIFLIPVGKPPALSVAWTLQHEMLFYLIFTTTYIFGDRSFKVILGIWSIGIVIASFFSDLWQLLSFLFDPHNIQFCLGVMVAVLTQKNKNSSSHLILGVFVIFLYAVVLHSGFFEQAIAEKIYLGLGFSFIVSGLCSIEGKVSWPRPLMIMGAASYSIYLVHNPLISIGNRLAAKLVLIVPMSGEVIFCVMVTLATIGGVIYYYFCEKQVLRLSKAWIQKSFS